MTESQITFVILAASLMATMFTLIIVVIMLTRQAKHSMNMMFVMNFKEEKDPLKRLQMKAGVDMVSQLARNNQTEIKKRLDPPKPPADKANSMSKIQVTHGLG